MKDEFNERFPSYVPLYYRIYAKIRKAYRQTSIRMAESKAKKESSGSIFSDGKISDLVVKGSSEYDKEVINKSAKWLEKDMERPDVKTINGHMEELKTELKNKGLHYTNTAGTFLSRMFYPRSEKTKAWENTWVISNAGIEPGYKVLDIGGASTSFSFYIASEGCDVSIIDNDWGNCGTLYNANYVAGKMKWKLKAYDRDVAKPLPFPDEYFDRVFSICTLEHLSSEVRRLMMKDVGRVLKPGGIAGLTMCYCNDGQGPLADNGLRLAYWDKLSADVIEPSGLKIYGNEQVADTDLDENFLGALFLCKP